MAIKDDKDADFVELWKCVYIIMLSETVCTH